MYDIQKRKYEFILQSQRLYSLAYTYDMWSTYANCWTAIIDMVFGTNERTNTPEVFLQHAAIR